MPSSSRSAVPSSSCSGSRSRGKSNFWCISPRNRSASSSRYTVCGDLGLPRLRGTASCRSDRQVASAAGALQCQFVIGEVALERATGLQLVEVALESLEEAPHVVTRARGDQPRAARERVAHLAADLAPRLLD